MATEEKRSNRTTAEQQNSSASITLTNNRVMRFLFTNKNVQHAVNLLTVAIFFYAIYRAAVGPTDSATNFGNVAFFGFWWAPVMILSLVFLGRIWCYFCPMGAIVRFTQRFGLQRHFPMYTRKWVVLGLPISVLSLTALSFAMARWPMYKVGVAYSPRLIPIYWLVILGVAVAVSLVYQRQAFCRYVCPATGVMSVTSKFSPLEVAQNTDTGVQCATLEYKSDFLSTDRRCTACMKCTTENPDEDVELRFRWPGAKVLTERIPLVDEALVALVIWAVFPIDHVLGGPVEETALVGSLPGVLAPTAAYAVSIIATILAFTAVNRLASSWSGIDWTMSFTKFGLAYAPLGIMFTFGSHAIGGLLESGGQTLNVFAGGLGIPLDLPAGASPEIVAAWDAFFVTGWLWLAVLWSAVIAWQVARTMTESKELALKAFAPHFALMAGSTYVVATVLATH
ncbi:4Fe-4S binding protein [Halostagnicola kamekurae]|uniref:4Fe-4S binding domain-containing protein n=1 Tax=Halostagnicola kamekurae TaxID=619731 RepID=A0A1I6TGD2_9EURY|nr:4Fe-4S binding protein [Halostagnicola kamekurae]SFS88259.1 4Fe-4S binding domain-containing protein [Halostagnicola kamekurae]